MINGQKVLIEHIYFGFDKYNLTAENKEKATNNAEKSNTVVLKVALDANKAEIAAAVAQWRLVCLGAGLAAGLWVWPDTPA